MVDSLFFEHPILNSPYEYPARHWELDAQGQPTQRVVEKRRPAEFITPIPKPRKRRGSADQQRVVFDEGVGLSTEEQQYDPTSVINNLRRQVDEWRSRPNPNDWQVTPETARLLQHWRHHRFSGMRPFFCQVEAVETVIWLTEVAPQAGKAGKGFIEHLANANNDANPDLARLALKLATGAGKTTVMAMLIAWQTINAVRRPQSKRFTRGFLVVAQRKLGVTRVIDLSATPFFLRGSGYAEGTLFPWTMSDFSLMDAIECGIVKMPRVPIADNIPGGEMPRYRKLWENIRPRMPKKGRGKARNLNPLSLPVELQTALEALYGHYEKTHRLWAEAGIGVPPCFIIVCQNTAISKLVYDFISGFHGNDDGSTTLQNGHLPLFQNFDEYGNQYARPRTLLIDSEQLESGDALDKNFREMASDEIERFRREIVERTGDRRQAENITEQDLLREVMNTVGKKERLGDSIRCVVSVSMLTEGWNANTVTHVLGVRAFGTQLLCVQVIGRALRRQSYDLNEEGLFNVEYADVLGITFDFTAKPVVAPPQPPRDTVQVKAVRPERDHLEIRFPRVEGYRVELPEERLTAEFNDDSVLSDCSTRNGAIPEKNRSCTSSASSSGSPNSGWITAWSARAGPIRPSSCTRSWPTWPVSASPPESRALVGERPIKAVLDPYNPTGSTMHVNVTTSRADRWQTDPRRCHVNWVILDSDWEAEFCRVAESHPQVLAYIKNHNLGLEVPYRYGSEPRKYIPDFIVLIDDGHGEDDPLHLVVEIKGYRREDAKEKKAAMENYWIPGVNNHGGYGRWAFAEFTAVYQIEAGIESEFDKMVAPLVGEAV